MGENLQQVEINVALKLSKNYFSPERVLKSVFWPGKTYETLYGFKLPVILISPRTISERLQSMALGRITTGGRLDSLLSWYSSFGIRKGGLFQSKRWILFKQK